MAALRHNDFLMPFSSRFSNSVHLVTEISQEDGSPHLNDICFTTDNVFNLISRTPNDSSMGMDSIPSFVLKECAQLLIYKFFCEFLELNIATRESLLSLRFTNLAEVQMCQTTALLASCQNGQLLKIVNRAVVQKITYCR